MVLPLSIGVGDSCGNGVADPGEACDDGNQTNGDGCTLSCDVQAGYTCSVPIAPQIQNGVSNGDFEMSLGSSKWAFASTNFGNPRCDLASCGAGGASTPSTGQGWVWLGGTTNNELTYIEQPVRIDVTDSELTFAIAQTACDSAADVAQVLIDGNVVATYTADSQACENSAYRTVAVDLAQAPGGPYNDGFFHTLRFQAETFATNGGISSFLFDDVVINRGIDPGQPSVCAVSSNVCLIERFDPGLGETSVQ